MNTSDAIKLFKKIPFSKSWMNSHVNNKTRKILNTETGQLEDKELGVFIFAPAPVIVKHFSNDKDFLSFRTENRSNKDWDYKLVADATENNNRRLAVLYASKIFEALDIKFIVDDSYTIYVAEEELQSMGESTEPEVKGFFNLLYVPKTLGKKQSNNETWS